DGVEVVVGRTESSEEAADPGRGGAKVTVQGRDGHLVRGAGADDWIVSWQLDGGENDCACYQFGVVAAHGLSRHALLALAESARPRAPHPTITAAALPADLRSLGTLGGVDLDMPGGPPRAKVSIDVHGVGYIIENYTGDPRLAPHMQFWGTVRHDRWRRVATAHGEMLLVSLQKPDDSDISLADVDPSAVVASLEPTSRAHAEAVGREVLLRPPDDTDRCELGGPPSTFLSGTAGDARWIVGLQVRGRGESNCVDIIEPGWNGRGGGGGGGPLAPPAKPDQIAMTGNSLQGDGHGRWHQVVIGDAPAAAVRVSVVTTYGTTDATLAHTGPSSGRRWFATVLAAKALAQSLPPAAVAYDADGHEIARSP
ncbi:MAG: hypothetical protein JO291_08765, partial [Acidimicrobiia bacterium]|nr:hypothetical protein [Acidimicrobiia bacterium]